MKSFTLSAAFAAVAAFALASPALADSQPVTITFAAAFGGDAFDCGREYTGVGSTNSTVRVADYRLFVTDVALTTASGERVPVTLDQDGKWQYDTVALLDFEDASGYCVNGTPDTNTTVTGTVPAGDYTGLSFKVGVPFEHNHGDPTLQPSPLNLTAMFWNWQGGYKFIKLDMATSGLHIDPVMPDTAANHAPPNGTPPAPRARGWALHLGSTGCASASRTTSPEDACASPNLMAIDLPTFDPATTVVVIDPAPVLAEANVDIKTPETSPGCMSFLNDDDCVPVMSRLGLPFRDIPAGEQRLVSAR